MEINTNNKYTHHNVSNACNKPDNMYNIYNIAVKSNNKLNQTRCTHVSSNKYQNAESSSLSYQTRIRHDQLHGHGSVIPLMPQ